MGASSTIEWTDASWTPIRARNRKTGAVGWHCEHKSTGCINCYAEGINLRLGTGLPFKPGHRNDIDIYLDPAILTQPLTWRKPRMIFVCSMTDLFADFVLDEWIDRMFQVMRQCPQHVFQVLTKRPRRMRDYCRHMAEHPGERLAYFPSRQGEKKVGANARVWPLPNVWTGTSCEDQPTANERLPFLLETPAAVRFVSGEPMLAPINFVPWCSTPSAFDAALLRAQADGFCTMEEVQNARKAFLADRGTAAETKLDQIIVGGESGPEGRFMHPDLPRSIRDQCEATGVAFNFKQWGRWAWAPEGMNFEDALTWGRKTFWSRVKYEHHSSGHTAFDVGKKLAGRLLDGRIHDGYPPQAERFRSAPAVPMTETLL